MSANLKNSSVVTELERSVFILMPKKGKAKECSNHHTIVLISHDCNVISKILQDKLQQYVNQEFPDVQLGLEKSEEPEIKLPTFTISLKHVYYHIRNESLVQVRCRIQEAWGWWAGMTQRDGMGREVGEGFRIGNMCTPVADS